MTRLDGVNDWSGWQWLFLLEGLPTIFAGILAVMFIVDSPEKASWLSQREKDLITFRLGARRRLWSTFIIAGALGLGVFLGMADIPLWVMATLFLTTLAVNQGLLLLSTRSATYRWYYRYVFAGLDAALISCLTLAFGGTTTVVIYFLAIVPYSFDRGRTLGYFSAIASALGFLLASWGHYLLHPGTTANPIETIVVAVLSLVDLGVLQRTWSYSRADFAAVVVTAP